jgi:type I restriction-modification system DNA methylase subunit
MPLFQRTVISKYLNHQNKELISSKWESYSKYFHNIEIQNNIKALKEEDFQEGFIRELFVNILGFVLNPMPNFNFVLEKKNVDDSRKADGAIIFDNKVKAVVELKATNTTDLGKVETQAFGYKNNHPDCVYVITSNFEKLRFYIDNAVEYLEFNLFTLNKEDFTLLYLCLGYENLSKDTAKKIKEESISEEDVITKKLYKDYSLFKRELYQNLILLNPQFEPLELFKKSQKLLDRFLFLFFGEDRYLLPPNSVRQIITDWNKLQELDVYMPLYDRFKQYFNYLNTGYKSKNYDVFAYNGGLFKPDEILDVIKIDDHLLYKHTLKLSGYDFASEVDVNILGHIFENSLNELDEIKAQLEGQVIDKSNTKRKKDGVFYTPKYITKYIVENTIGKLCEEKKQALEILEEEYFTDKKRQKKTIQGLVEKLDTYRKWLLQLTICDPACGSGAFLNQALDFLIEEHQYIDELQAKLFGDAMVMSDMENSILENNLFGVDLNEESVEIAKLSLWLRTAQPNRKLNDLNGNIKCGNSLIDDVTVAGDKAFNWQEAFPKVFENGGFDIVIGNPPYVRVQTIKDNLEKESIELERKYESATKRYDLFVLFIEKSYSLIKPKGVVSFILPHKFLIADFGFGIRTFLKEKEFINELILFGHEIIFKDASTYTCILKLAKNSKTLNYIEISSKNLFQKHSYTEVQLSKLNNTKWELLDTEKGELLDKLKKQPFILKDFLKEISQGVKNTSDKIFMLKGEFKNDLFIGYSEELNQEVEIEASIMMAVAKGRDIKRYDKLDINYFQIYPHYFDGTKTVPYEESDFIIKFPRAYKYICEFKSFLIEKKIRYKTNPKYWYSLHRSREIEMFQTDKIVTATIQNYPHFTIDNTKALTDAGGYSIVIKSKTDLTKEQLLPILNSKLMWFYIKNTSSVYSGGYFAFNTTFLNPFPVPEIFEINKFNFADLGKLNINNTSLFQEILQKFQRTIQRKFELEELPKKLQDWHKLSYSEFIIELGKKKVKLSLSQEAEWEDYFMQESKKALELKATIDATDKAIDTMVYELYRLSEEEIAIVERN